MTCLSYKELCYFLSVRIHFLLRNNSIYSFFFFQSIICSFCFRSLEILDDSLLLELRDYYRSWLPCMSRRDIKSDSKVFDDTFAELIYSKEPVSLDKVGGEEVTSTKTSLKTQKKKVQREKKMSESERVRNTSISSITSDEELLSSMDSKDSKKDEINQVMNREESWIKVWSFNSTQIKSV